MADNPKANTITRAEQKQLTRQKLIEATLEVVAAQGLSGVTMARVADQAGLSRGIGNFHFQSKEQLLLEVLRTIHNEFDTAWRSVVSDTDRSPAERLMAVIETMLTSPIASKKKLAVWLAFWGEASARKTYLEICAAHDREYDAAIENLLGEMSDDEFQSHGLSLGTIAKSLTAFIDGFWVEYLISADRYNSEMAVQACFAFLARFFSVFKEELENFK
jgi:TetR/AcrR family transcriptional repressor of bet genes